MKKVREALMGLLSAVDPEETGLRLVGVLVTHEKRPAYNFSLFDVTENEMVLMLQIGDTVVYLAFESEEEIDEDEYPELVEELIKLTLPGVKDLIKAVKEENLPKPGIVYDEMSPELKEFLYDILMKHMHGRSVYDQTEAA
ncbi:hypothetical protein [Thermococcus gorgonarius]|uniref:Uncharacterized protein n=1 Tax=Thermococcus gorgonarius TaxID=71997 RepID=A0A2Z2M5A1_THEGO|nr:hypothetical protein [Thermococcus gorgonarius]ASJ00273.1 hypothetical protein A3K92_01655 [Thermococcus gorgonarius]